MLAQRKRALAEANGRLHAQIWRSRDERERAAMRHEIEANTRLLREVEYLERAGLSDERERHSSI